MEDSLRKRYSIKLSANIISGIIGMILIAIVPKALGPIAYGQFTYLQNFFMQLIGFFDMGSSIAFFTKLSARHTRKELITFYFLYSLIVLSILFIFIYLVDIVDYTKTFLPDIPSQYIHMGLLFGFFTWFSQIFIKISDAYALTVSVELIKIAHKIVSLLLLLYFVYVTTFDLNGYFYYNYIVLFSFLFILSWVFIKKGIFNKNTLSLNIEFKNLSKEFIKYSSPLLINSVVNIAVGLFDIWLLQKVAGSIQVGFYGLAYSLAAMCFVFTSAMTPIITREFAKSYEQKDLEQMRKLFSRYIPMLYSLAAFFGVFISFESENLLIIFTDENFKAAYLVLVIMAFYPLYQTYGQLTGSIFYATGKTKLIRKITLMTQSIGILLSYIFIYLLDYEAVGLALKMFIVAVIGVNMQLYYNAKFLKLDMKHFVWHQIYSVVLFVILALIPTLFISFDSPLVEFLVSGFLYTILVTICVYIFPQVFATSRAEIRLDFSKLYRRFKK